MTETPARGTDALRRPVRPSFASVSVLPSTLAAGPHSASERRTALPWVYDDGGRADAGYRGHASDCVCRAIAIATGAPYRTVYETLADARAATGKSRSAREGMPPKVYREYLRQHGWVWTPTMQIGSGCRVHLADGELPDEPRMIVRLSRHLVAVIDGVVRDTFDPTRDGTRCVYGLWRPA